MHDFYIHSGVRKRHTRTLRMKQPQHAALVQHIGGLIIRRSRPVGITVDRAVELRDRLITAQREGRLELRTRDGRLVDLSTLEPIGLVAEPAPVPNPPLDSAANDIPAGQHMPQYIGGTGVLEEGAVPSILPEQVSASEESEEDGEDDEEEDTTKSIPPLAPATESPALPEPVEPEPFEPPVTPEEPEPTGQELFESKPRESEVIKSSDVADLRDVLGAGDPVFSETVVPDVVKQAKKRSR